MRLHERNVMGESEGNDGKWQSRSLFEDAGQRIGALSQ